MPEPIKRLHAVALPLPRDNVDTDELIPVSENTRSSTSGWGDGLFAARRYRDGAGRVADPGFILNRSPFDRAAILVSGANFGCGSSRESAVWALRDYGFRIVIAVSFNETFERNCIINGIVPLAVARTDAERLDAAIAEDAGRGLTVDLGAGLIWIGDPERSGAGPAAEPVTFALDPFYAAMLTSGRTENDMLAGLQPAIDALRARMIVAAPWLDSFGPA